MVKLCFNFLFFVILTRPLYQLMGRKKIVYLISDIDRAIAFEWIADQVDKSRFELVFVLINCRNSYFKTFLEKHKTKHYLLDAQSKQSFPLALFRLIGILRKEKPAAVHCHLFTASILGLTAAKLLGIKMRIHTRHHASQHHMYHPNAIKYDRWINHCSTHIIAITENVKRILIEQENVDTSKLVLIHHGFDLDFFSKVDAFRKKTLQQKYNPNQQYPVVGVVSRYTMWKGVQHIIPAFLHLLKDYPNALLVLANTNGNDAQYIKSLLKEIPQKNYLEVDFEYDNAALYYVFDLFVHVPINAHAEAFGQTYVEALACGIPSIFTLSGIAHDFVQHNHNALVVGYEHPKEIYLAMKNCIENKSLRETLISNGRKDVENLFSLHGMIQSLQNLYQSNPSVS